VVRLTTIACDKRSIAGDLQYTNANTGLKWKGNPKVFKFQAHPNIYTVDFMVGFAGTASDIIGISSFFSKPDKFEKPVFIDTIMGLVLTEKGELFVFDADPLKWIKIKSQFYAIGSGANIAMGALACGKTPQEAVKLASKYDSYTGMGIKSYSW
jgi:ATP-dependent protease HslVU (ClpYQ) peptidase subunit